MSAQNPRVLIITYYWPPAGGPGVQRWLKFAKYLPEAGFTPVVLTVDPNTATYPVQDETLLKDTESIEVHHAPTKELFSLYKKASGRKEVPFSGFANESDKPGPRQRLAKFVRGNFFIPDPRKAWNKRAIKKALELIDTYDIQHVITTSPPHSSQLIGLAIKARRNVTWLADLRDPWTDIYYYDLFYPTRLARAYDASLERKVLERADAVSTVSQDLVRLFSEKSASISKDKFLILPNGYDEADFDRSLKVNKDKWTISYTGTFTTDYSMDGFYQAIESLTPEQAGKVRVQFIGRRDEVSEKHLNQLSEQTGVEVILKGYVPHSEAVVAMQRSHALLLVIPDLDNNKGILTGKIFEYLGSKRPILGVGPIDGDAAEIISQTQAGAFYDYSDTEGMKQWLVNSIDSVSEGSKSAYQYERKSLTQLVAKALSNS
ncbi:MAG: glycosyltransferase family 4 protein [Schleiferiaceae bacterium]